MQVTLIMADHDAMCLSLCSRNTRKKPWETPSVVRFPFHSLGTKEQTTWSENLLGSPSVPQILKMGSEVLVADPAELEQQPFDAVSSHTNSLRSVTQNKQEGMQGPNAEALTETLEKELA